MTITKKILGALGAIILAAAMGGCVGEGDPEGAVGGELSQHQAVSDCGGFGGATPGEGDEEYCAAERLDWSFDTAAGTLTITDSRALLNCCGDRGIEVEMVDGVYVVTETDAPDGDETRCRCMCVFDFELTVEGLPSGVIPVRVERDVTDDEGAPGVLFEGDIDLSAGEGSVVLDEQSAEGWC